MTVALAFLALLIELCVGYPDRLVRAIGHPVIWMGRLIALLDRALNRHVGEAHAEGRPSEDTAARGVTPRTITSPPEGEVGSPSGPASGRPESRLRDPGGGYGARDVTPLPNPPPQGGRERRGAGREARFHRADMANRNQGGRERRGAGREGELDGRVKPGSGDGEDGLRSSSRIPGLIALLLLVAVAGLFAFALERTLLRLLPSLGLFLVALAASSLIAQRSLHDHVARVAAALATGGVKAGREAVSHIVGRDPEALDEAGVARAAIESLAENFSDGVVAPAFWLALAGLPGGAIYKAVNTADSMIGHRTPRHEHFGWAAARLDDLLNLPAARLSALLIIAAAAITPGASAAKAWHAVRRDASRHRSPNAGYPESAMAGALGLSLAGPRVYAGALVADAYMGDGRSDATASDIRAALALYRGADAVFLAILAGLAAPAVAFIALA